MLNLLRMELRKIFRDKGLYITLAVFLGILVIAVVSLKLVTDPQLTQKAVSAGFELDASDLQDGQEFISSTKYEFLGNLLFSGGLMVSFAAVLSSLMCCQDFSTGFAKNIFSFYPRRMDYLLSKLAAVSIVTGFFMLVLTLLSLGLLWAFGFSNPLGDPVQLLFMLLTGWAALTALIGQNLLFCMMTRSVWISILLSLVCGFGTVPGLLQLFLGAWDLSVGKLFPSYLAMTAPYVTGSESFSLSSSLLLSLLGSGSPELNPLFSVFVSFVWILIYLLLASRVLNKKDIC